MIDAAIVQLIRQCADVSHAEAPPRWAPEVATAVALTAIVAVGYILVNPPQRGWQRSAWLQPRAPSYAVRRGGPATFTARGHANQHMTSFRAKGVFRVMLAEIRRA